MERIKSREEYRRRTTTGGPQAPLSMTCMELHRRVRCTHGSRYNRWGVRRRNLLSFTSQKGSEHHGEARAQLAGPAGFLEASTMCMCIFYLGGSETDVVERRAATIQPPIQTSFRDPLNGYRIYGTQLRCEADLAALQPAVLTAAMSICVCGKGEGGVTGGCLPLLGSAVRYLNMQ